MSRSVISHPAHTDETPHHPAVQPRAQPSRRIPRSSTTTADAAAPAATEAGAAPEDAKAEAVHPEAAPVTSPSAAVLAPPPRLRHLFLSLGSLIFFFLPNRGDLHVWDGPSV